MSTRKPKVYDLYNRSHNLKALSCSQHYPSVFLYICVDAGLSELRVMVLMWWVALAISPFDMNGTRLHSVGP